MATVRIRLQWGGITSYMDRDMFEYCWDGGVEIKGGRLISAWQIESLDYGHYVFSERRLPLNGQTWRSRTNQSLAGVVLEVEGDAGTVIEAHTTQKSARFTLGELLEKRYLRWPVGAKYSGITLAAMPEGEGPFKVDAGVEPGCLDLRLAHGAFEGAYHYGQFNNVEAAWVLPGRAVQAVLELPRAPYHNDVRRSAVALELRLSLAESLGKWYVDSPRYSPLSVQVNGREMEMTPTYFRTEAGIWPGTQWIEFVGLDIPPERLKQGANRLTIRNDSETDLLTVISAQLREKLEGDLQVASIARWVLQGEKFDLLLRCLRPHDDLRIECRGAEFEGSSPTHLPQGLHRLTFVAGDRPEVATITIADGSNSRLASIPIYAVPVEEPTWKVGATLQNVKHDASREVDSVIDYCHDTQMGNYLQFRTDIGCTYRWALEGVRPGDWERWARLLRKHGIYFTMINAQGWKNYKAEPLGPDPKLYETCHTLKEHGGEHFFSTHFHEYSRWIYGFVPGQFEQAYPEGRSMRDAKDQYVGDLAAIEGIPGVPRQGGQSAPLMAYDYESGMDYIAAETMAFNASHLFAAMRGAARAFDKRVWGIHNATYWVKAPDDFTKLRLNYLNCYLTYLAGGNLALSEDGHFNVAHSNAQQGFHSEEPSRLREIIRKFYRFVNTHPRKGRPQVNLAVAQGNLSCEIISFPLHFAGLRERIGRVWGAKGGSHPKWQYGYPERGAVLLGELMPYWQDGHHLRHWFTGSPYGQFDITPIDRVPAETLAAYRVLIFLGWNTMTPEIYEKLRGYVESGGTLFMALPHLSTQEDRLFLTEMEDLELLKGGDFSDLFGVKVNGPEEKTRPLEAHWVADPSDEQYLFPTDGHYRIPAADEPIRPARVETTTARVLVQDDEMGQPLLVANSVGKGRAYLLTTWAYPGHPALEELVRDVVAALAEGSLGDVRLEDPSREVTWSVWGDETDLRSIYLLNTDWTEEGNTKSCRLVLAGKSFSIQIQEGDLTAVTWRRRVAISPKSQEFYVEDVRSDSEHSYRVTVHGHGPGEFVLFLLDQSPTSIRCMGADIPFCYDHAHGKARFALDLDTVTRAEIEIETQSAE